MSQDENNINASVPLFPKDESEQPKTGIKRRLPDEIVDLLKKDQSKDWGVTEIAQKLKLDPSKKTKVHYHLTKLVEQKIINRSENGRYSWNTKTIQDEKIIPLLEAIHIAGGSVTFEKFTKIREEILPLAKNPELTTEAILSSKYFGDRVHDPDEDVMLNPEGVQKLGLCVGCGEKLTGERFVIAQELFYEDNISSNQDNIQYLIHARCVPKLRGMQVSPDFLCGDCELPLGMGDILVLFCPESFTVVDKILCRHLNYQEYTAYIHLKHTKKREYSGWEESWTLPHIRGGVRPIGSVFNSTQLCDIEKLMGEIFSFIIINNPHSTEIYTPKFMSERVKEIHKVILEEVRESKEQMSANRREVLEYFYGKLGVFFARATRDTATILYAPDDIAYDAPLVQLNGKRYHSECYRRLMERKVRDKV